MIANEILLVSRKDIIWTQVLIIFENVICNRIFRTKAEI